jgi:hypothetical protein
MTTSFLVRAFAVALGCCAFTGCGAHYEPADEAPIAASLAIVTTAGIGFTTHASAADPEGQPISYELLDAPRHGILTFYPDSGAFRYVPSWGFIGEDVFTYCAFDGSNWSNVAVVRIMVEEPVVIIGVG